MDIKTALDWTPVETQLFSTIGLIRDYDYRVQAFKMAGNLRLMVTQLSKLELEARRSPFKSNQRVNEQLEKINTQIYELEQWITMLMLS